LDIVDQLELDIDDADCTIVVGDHASLSGGDDVTWEIEGNLLKVKQEQRGGWWWKSKSAPITLVLPGPLSKMDIDVDAGSVLVSKMTVTQDLTCDVDAGTITLKDVTVGRRLEADVDAGSVDYNGHLYGAAKLDCDAGSIHLGLLPDSAIGKVTGNVDAGEVKVYVDGEKVIDRDGYSETISADIPGVEGKELATFDCDAGRISIEVETDGNAEET
ncbi:MAG: hypothetical protein Q4P20_05775, partial [Eubacteriales bacterium]|nr:hypothetical protein [Eubacteriales bacterium]